MQLTSKRYQLFESKSYPSIKVGPLNEYVCNKCGEGLYTIKSRNLIESKLSEHRARCDAKITTVAEVINVSEASRVLRMTRQGVIQLMKRGKLPYVFFGHSRLPKRQAIIHYASSHH